MNGQRIEGNCNVQIQGAVGSHIQITYGGATRAVPLEPAYVPVAEKVRSPARLVRAHAGVIPYVERGGLVAELEGWIDSEGPFAGHVIGGPGGAGKTRLAVELCQRMEQRGWLCGFLVRKADAGMLDSLVDAPTPRLVVIDYAETRAEQLELLLPLLSAKASSESPVRALLLVRGDGTANVSWTERLANRVDSLDAVLDECEVRRLEDSPFGVEDRQALFEAAVPALAERLGSDSEAASPPDLAQETFASPLMVVVAACLAALGESAPATREALLDEAIAHERRYWRDRASELGVDDVSLERMVALATLLGAETEQEGEHHLRLLHYLRDAQAERVNRLARWVSDQYPGSRWWNPLEPDLVGEHLVARCFTDQPEVLRGALAAENPEQVTRPLEVLGRAAADHASLADALAPILSGELVQLCEVAVSQAEAIRDMDLLYGKAVTVAAAIDALLESVEVEIEVLPVVGDLMPPRNDLVLNDLAVTLTAMYARRLRPMAQVPDANNADVVELARALINLSSRLANAGRYADGLEAIEEATQLLRKLTETDPAAYASELSGCLSNLSNRLGNAERHSEALDAIEESVQIRRRLAEEDPATYAPDLARSLNNLSNHLGNAERHEEGLAAIEESVQIRRKLAESEPAVFTSALARSLNNQCGQLAALERHPEALAAIEESVRLQRLLAAANPAAYAADLANTLISLGICLARDERHPDALAAIEESVASYRHLVELNPTVYAPGLARALANQVDILETLGEEEAAAVARREIATLLRRFGEAVVA